MRRYHNQCLFVLTSRLQTLATYVRSPVQESIPDCWLELADTDGDGRPEILWADGELWVLALRP